MRRPFSGGDLTNTTVESGELGRVVVRGRIEEDDTDWARDEIRAASGRFFARDRTWAGWIDPERDHWFGQEDDARACVGA